MYRVSDAMTAAPLTLGPGDGTSRAVTLMRNARVRHVPIVNDGRLVGLVTQRDLLHMPQGRVRDYMVTQLHTTTANSPLRKAARCMYLEKIGCLPVIDAEQKVIGIITEADFVRFAAEMITDLDRAVVVAKHVAGGTTRG